MSTPRCGPHEAAQGSPCAPSSGSPVPLKQGRLPDATNAPTGGGIGIPGQREQPFGATSARCGGHPPTARRPCVRATFPVKQGAPNETAGRRVRPPIHVKRDPHDRAHRRPGARRHLDAPGEPTTPAPGRSGSGEALQGGLRGAGGGSSALGVHPHGASDPPGGTRPAASLASRWWSRRAPRPPAPGATDSDRDSDRSDPRRRSAASGVTRGSAAPAGRCVPPSRSRTSPGGSRAATSTAAGCSGRPPGGEHRPPRGRPSASTRPSWGPPVCAGGRRRPHRRLPSLPAGGPPPGGEPYRAPTAPAGR